MQDLTVVDSLIRVSVHWYYTCLHQF